MSHDWLLVETLGSTPAVVAQGRRTTRLVPITSFLRRDPHLMAIQTAIGETLRAGHGLSSITPKNDRVIRTEVVRMTDGRIHGVQLWVGPPDMEPPERPIPGAAVWHLTSGTAVATREALANRGLDTDTGTSTAVLAFAENFPVSDIDGDEARALAMLIRRRPGERFCGTFHLNDFRGEPITVGLVARTMLDPDEQQPVCRVMNWRAEPDPPAGDAGSNGAQQAAEASATPGVHRALLDLTSWTLLKWLDEPAPFFDWRASLAADHLVHPEDRHRMRRMAADFASGTACGIVRMAAGNGDGWAPVHVTVDRVELDDQVYAGLAALRRPDAAELAALAPA